MEFGVGSTTSVIAEALRRNGEGHLITVDSNKQWLTATQEAMPKELRERVTFVHSGLEQVSYDGVKCHVYTNIPNEPLDFLYVDGPDPADVPGWGQKTPMSLDPVRMEDRFRPGFRMVVEGRTLNSEFLQKALKRKYRVSDDKRFRVTTFDLIS